MLFGKNNKTNKKFKFYKKDYHLLPRIFKRFEMVIDLVNISNDPASELNKKFTYKLIIRIKLNYTKIRNLKNIKNIYICRHVLYMEITKTN